MSGPSIDSASSAKGKPVRVANRSNHRSTLAPLSPQSMSAEIEQLDAIANLTGSNEKGDGSTESSSSASNITRKIRNVNQPVSYAEPSTKAKLRRGVSLLDVYSLDTVMSPLFDKLTWRTVALVFNMQMNAGCIIP